MTKEEYKEELKKKIEVLTPKSKRGGGQHTNICAKDVSLLYREMDIEINVGYYRSQIKNYNMALELMYRAIQYEGNHLLDD